MAAPHDVQQSRRTATGLALPRPHPPNALCLHPAPQTMMRMGPAQQRAARGRTQQQQQQTRAQQRRR
jgi:hypothetical protein